MRDENLQVPNCAHFVRDGKLQDLCLDCLDALGGCGRCGLEVGRLWICPSNYGIGVGSPVTGIVASPLMLGGGLEQSEVVYICISSR